MRAARHPAVSFRGPLDGWQVFCLRMADAGTRRLLAALRSAGASATHIAPLRLVAASADDRLARIAAHDQISHWLFTSPASVRFAARLDRQLFATGSPLHQAASAGSVFAPGPGTARALADRGLSARSPNMRFDSEGLLALPELAAPLHGQVLIVGAPDGRGLLAPTLQARGARTRDWHVYRRDVQPIPARRIAALMAAPAPLLLVSSQAMLDALLARLGPARSEALASRARLLASSQRLADHAARHGFRPMRIAASAQPADLFDAVLTWADPADSATNGRMHALAYAHE